MPTDTNGEDIKNPLGRLVCYQARLSKTPRQSPHTPVLGLHVSNQFGLERLDAVKEAEFCVPSIEYVPSPTATSTVVATATRTNTRTPAPPSTATSTASPTASPTLTASPVPVCGNNNAENGEVCDGTDSSGETCASLGFSGGTLACLANCQGFDSSACTFPSDPPADPALIAPPIDQTVVTDIFSATQFLYTGPGRVQFGLNPGTIQPYRAAVLRGVVTDHDGNSLPAVQITASLASKRLTPRAADGRASQGRWRRMEERKAAIHDGRSRGEPDVTDYCPNCGARGEWQKCKLLCPNPQCSVRIILACVD